MQTLRSTYDGDAVIRDPALVNAFAAQHAECTRGRAPLPVWRYAAQAWAPLLTAAERASIAARARELEAMIQALPDDDRRTRISAPEREFNQLVARLADDRRERQLQAMPAFRGQGAAAPTVTARPPAVARAPAAAPPAPAATPQLTVPAVALTGPPLTREERLLAAYHEAGHAVVALVAGRTIELVEVYARHAADGTVGRTVHTGQACDAAWSVAVCRAGHVAETLIARARGAYAAPRSDFGTGRDEEAAARIAADADGLALEAVRLGRSPTFSRGTVLAHSVINQYSPAVRAVAGALFEYGTIPPEDVVRAMGY